ncbi:CocE/NonD family hydrolase [Mesobacillus thioparans]|uniref:CocE/NonD family hydrolase n=1 Tax=Mesobacillus thioparans TaxID=370439 RepID=UPI0039EDF0F6
MCVLTETWCPMPDGVLLSTLICLPKEYGPFPVILTRTPYNKIRFKEEAMAWASRGFAFVAQDVRGKFMSDGEWVPYKNEGKDGLNTLLWLQKQTWSGEQVFLIGGSYGAFTAFALAQNDFTGLITSLITMVPAMGLFETAFDPSGIFHLSDRVWWDGSFGSSKDSKEELLYKTISEDQSLLMHIPVSTLNQFFPMVLSNWKRLFDKSNVVEQLNLARIKQPTMHIGGWFDPFIKQTIDNYVKLLQKNKNQTIIIGPWEHEINRDVSFDMRYPGGNIPLGVIEEDWLKNLGNSRYPKVLLYVTGTNTWIATDSWPSENISNEIKLLSETSYLTGNEQKENLSIEYNPEVPCPSREYPSRRNDLEQRKDMINFTLEPFQSDTTIMGQVRIELYVQSSSPQSDFFVYLTEVHSQTGESIYITHGVARSLLNNEEIKLISIECKPIAHTIKASNQLRISITNSSFPRYSRNLNKIDSDYSSSYEKATNTIFINRDFPSNITLPKTNFPIERYQYEF